MNSFFTRFWLLPVSPYRVVEESSSDVLLKGRLSYRAQDDLLFYFTVAEGFRSGGINLQSVFEWAISCSSLDALISYELGTKTSWYDGRVLLNGSVYFQTGRTYNRMAPTSRLDGRAGQLHRQRGRRGSRGR